MIRRRSSRCKEIKDLISRKGSKIHMVGICGVGMAGLAMLLKKNALKVDGCDANLNSLGQWLVKNRVPVQAGHAAEHVKGARALIRTAAVGDDEPEVQAAVRAGIPVFFRGEVLPCLLEQQVSVAVCGTHGKTTTSTFIAQVLKAAGRDPSWCIGGNSAPLGGVAGTGDGQHLVVEADESDGTLALYKPAIAVITNIEFDHMEHFSSVASFEKCFRTFTANTTRRVFFCIEDPRARYLCSKNALAVSYGFRKSAAIRAVSIVMDEESSSYVLFSEARRLGTIKLPVPGMHNVLNSLAAAAVCLELGLGFDEIRKALRAVVLPLRRFETITETRGIRVISDYAHHPTEVRALVAAASKVPHKRLLAVYQPHRYTRTLALGRDFPAAFEGVDELVLCPVYAASERPLRGGTVWDLYRYFRRQGWNRSSRQVVVASNLAQAWQYYRQKLQRGDLFLVTGAGDVEKIACWAKTELSSATRSFAKKRLHDVKLHFDQPLAAKTTMNVGGSADIFAEVLSEKGLQALMKFAKDQKLPFRILGAGSNVVVPDLGLRGITARLVGQDFSAISKGHGKEVLVGAGAPIAKLVGWMEQHGFGGYEFLTGIPGTVGGAVRMNAGAWGDEIGRHVRWIRVMGPRGSRKISRKSLKFEYRKSAIPPGAVIVEVALEAGEAEDAATILAKRVAIAEKRGWWQGLRTAGSVFRNHPGSPAGKLLDKAGMKGAGVGGASVFQKHANVIVTTQGALASDVRCLVETMRSEVESRFAVRLETEIIFLE